jgi:DNA repair protein RecO (recombination protein O)
MLRTPVAQLSQTDWDQRTAADLRRFLVRQIESHIERRLVTAPLFEPSEELWPRMNTDEHG